MHISNVITFVQQYRQFIIIIFFTRIPLLFVQSGAPWKKDTRFGIFFFSLKFRLVIQNMNYNIYEADIVENYIHFIPCRVLCKKPGALNNKKKKKMNRLHLQTFWCYLPTIVCTLSFSFQTNKKKKRTILHLLYERITTYVSQ